MLSQNYDNMIKKSRIEILNLFRKNIFLSETIRAISLSLKKQYSQVYDAMQELVKLNIIKIKEVGNSKVCELNLSNESIYALSYLEGQEALSKNIKPMNEVLKFKEFLDDIVIVAGSYAKGKETPKSDIDLVIITRDDAFKKQKLIENLTATMYPGIHPVVMTQKDFVNMLTDKEANFGKEVYYGRLIYRNPSRYYELLREAIENGFRG